jgi:hypothetical protein
MTTVDWPLILRELKAAGYSFRGIQAAIGLHKDRCHRIAHGDEPRYSEGIALLRLWDGRNEPRVKNVVAVAHIRQGSSQEYSRVLVDDVLTNPRADSHVNDDGRDDEHDCIACDIYDGILS